jgi:hypothetical protein
MMTIELFRRTITGVTPLGQISDALRADGYVGLLGREAEIRFAAQRGCLLWTSERLTTTDASRIDVQPAQRDMKE